MRIVSFVFRLSGTSFTRGRWPWRCGRPIHDCTSVGSSKNRFDPLSRGIPRWTPCSSPAPGRGAEAAVGLDPRRNRDLEDAVSRAPTGSGHRLPRALLKSAIVTRWTGARRRVGLARPWRRESSGRIRLHGRRGRRRERRPCGGHQPRARCGRLEPIPPALTPSRRLVAPGGARAGSLSIFHLGSTLRSDSARRRRSPQGPGREHARRGRVATSPIRDSRSSSRGARVRSTAPPRWSRPPAAASRLAPPTNLLELARSARRGRPGGRWRHRTRSPGGELRCSDGRRLSRQRLAPQRAPRHQDGGRLRRPGRDGLTQGLGAHRADHDVGSAEIVAAARRLLDG